MNIQTLRVFNELKNLKLTDNDFESLEKEQSDKKRTGVFIQAVRGNKYIGVNHDKKHSIVIAEFTKEEIIVPESRILFNVLLTFKDVPEQLFILHNIFYRETKQCKALLIAKNVKAFKKCLCSVLSQKDFVTLGDWISYGASKEMIQKNERLKQKELQSLFWLFNDVYKQNPKKLRKNIPTITHVFICDNYRLAIFNEKCDYMKRSNTMYYSSMKHIKESVYKIKAFTPDNPRYNYVSPEREVFRYDYGCEVWVHETLTGKISDDDLRVMSKRCDKNWILLTPDEITNLNAFARAEMLINKREQSTNINKSKFEKKILQQYKNGKVVRFGIEFHKNSMKYEDLSFTGDSLSEYLINEHVLLSETPDFGKIIDGYIDYVLKPKPILNHQYGDIKAIESTFRGVTHLSYNRIKLHINTRNNYIYVNNSRISKADVITVVKKLRTFKNQNECDNYLTFSSKHNLQMQTAIEEKAISLGFYIYPTEDNCFTKNMSSYKVQFSLPVILVKNKVFTHIRNRKYRITKTTSLLKITKSISSSCTYYSGGNLERTINLLSEAIQDITPKEISFIIKDGITYAKKNLKEKKVIERKRIERSKEFIEHAIQLTKAKKVNGGYFVKGVSNKLYFIDSVNLQVWTIKKGAKDKYLCIVDSEVRNNDGTYKAQMNDRIAKRILMLSKDMVTAREIYENGDRVDDYWLSLMNNYGEVN